MTENKDFVILNLYAFCYLGLGSLLNHVDAENLTLLLSLSKNSLRLQKFSRIQLNLSITIVSVLTNGILLFTWMGTLDSRESYQGSRHKK